MTCPPAAGVCCPSPAYAAPPIGGAALAGAVYGGGTVVDGGILGAPVTVSVPSSLTTGTLQLYEGLRTRVENIESQLGIPPVVIP